MKNYIIYTYDEVQYSYQGPTSKNLVLPEGHYCVENPNKVEDLYVLDGQLLNKKPNPTTLTGTTLENIPPKSSITINEEWYDTFDNPRVELEFDQPGTYKIKVYSFGYYDQEFIVEN